MTTATTRVLAVLNNFGAAGNEGNVFETTDHIHVQGRLTVELLDDVLEVLRRFAELGLAISISDEFDTEVTLDDVREQVGQRVSIGLTKPNTGATYYFLTTQGFRAFLDEPRALDARRILIADLATAFETLACQFDEWTARVPDDISPSPVADIKPKRFVYDLTGRCPSSIGAIIEKRPPAIAGEAYIAWRSWATQRLRDVVVSELRDEGTVVLKGDRTIVLVSTPLRDLNEYDFRIATDAAHWIYAEATKDIEARHTFFVNSLSREWQSSDNWFDGLLSHGRSALDSAGNYYRRYLSDTTGETVKSLADMRKSLADDVVKVTQQTRDLINMLWRDFAIAVAAIVAKATIGSQNRALAQWLLIAGAVLLFASIVMTLVTNANFGRLLKNTWNEWRKRLYGYLTNDDYKSLAEGPLEQASQAYRTAAWIVGGLYGATIMFMVVLSLVSMKPAAMTPSSASSTSPIAKPSKAASHAPVPRNSATPTSLKATARSGHTGSGKQSLHPKR